MAGYVRGGIAYNSEDEADLAEAIPSVDTSGYATDRGYIAEAVLGSAWLVRRDEQMRAEGAAQAAAAEPTLPTRFTVEGSGSLHMDGTDIWNVRVAGKPGIVARPRMTAAAVERLIEAGLWSRFAGWGAAAESSESITRATLADFANDLLDAWGIEDENPPSLTEQFVDAFARRFGAASLPAAEITTSEDPSRPEAASAREENLP